MWQTHSISNQVDDYADYNLLSTDPILRQALARAGADWAEPALLDYGEQLGRRESFAQAELANRHGPELRSHDARGRRIDQVEFHPAWHEFLAQYRGQGLVSLAFETERPGRWSAFAAGFYLHGQIEAGSLCPATMTQACIPVLQQEPALFERLRGQLYSRDHDPRDLPLERKTSLWVGMGMTEKQGGSDLRTNTTRATALGAGGRGAAYNLRGHKWFFSAPMCDAHLVLARTEAGPSCFWVPRWRPDGTKNPILIQRLKSKLGNRSNSSSEVEFADAWGLMLGEDGRGIPTIIEMAGYTRLNCVIGSAGIMRQALVQALHYARERMAFGKRLAEQPLMRSVLADLALESEAAALLMMRLAQAFERGADDPAERAWQRVMTPAAKFWVCKRAVELCGEAMEVLGGNGYVEEGVLARLYREAPVNSIWEGSGNVMCLDLLRAIAREPQAALALLDELQQLAGDSAPLRSELSALRDLLARTAAADFEALGRQFAQRLVLLAQACLLSQHAPSEVAEAFIASRLLDAHCGRVFGALDTRGIAIDALLARALPV